MGKTTNQNHFRWKSFLNPKTTPGTLWQKTECQAKQVDRLHKEISWCNKLQWVQGKRLPNWLRRNRKCSQISPTKKVKDPRCDLEPYIDRSYACTESIKSRWLVGRLLGEKGREVISGLTLQRPWFTPIKERYSLKNSLSQLLYFLEVNLFEKKALISIFRPNPRDMHRREEDGYKQLTLFDYLEIQYF